MKDKILYLVIGVLIGAIITVAGFTLYNKNCKSNPRMPDGAPGQMQFDKNQQGGPGGNRGKSNSEPPSKPGESSNADSTDTNSNSPAKESE